MLQRQARGSVPVIEIPGYSIEATLGRGGMATVYLAVQESLQRKVALKVLDPQLAASDPGFTQRFVREGRIAASLRHRHILAIFDVGVHQGMAYLALEYLPGGSLAGEVGRKNPREALRLLREIGSALALVHKHGVVHRDIKPENILRHDDGGYVLADFGIARMAGLSMVTKEGSTIGTPAYMAPEQWRNQQLDGRADLYSLGVVLYQVLTGELPYAGADGWAIGMQHIQAPVPRLPAACAGLQQLLGKLLAKDANARFANAEALLAEVDALALTDRLDAAPIAETKPQIDPIEHLKSHPERLRALLESPSRWSRGRRWGAGLAGIVLLTALTLAWRWGAAAADWEHLFKTSKTLATVAVLPCDTYADDADQRMWGDVLAEELIHRLGRLRALTVIARSSSFPLRGQNLSAGDIGERLHASHLLACSIRPTPAGVRIVAELVETASGTQRWSAEFDRSGTEMLGVVDDLAVGISEKLLVNLAGAEQARLISHRTQSIEAIRLIEQARLRAREVSLAGIEAARELIAQALKLDPDYAQAQLALADVSRSQMQLQQRDAAWWRAQVEPLLKRALELDPELPAALILRSELRCGERDWNGCRADIEQALGLEPGAADVQAGAAHYFMHLGSRQRAVEHALRLLQIEPDVPSSWDTLTLALTNAGRLDEALAASERSIARFPEHWPSWHARALVFEQLGRCSEGVAAHEQALKLGAGAEVELNSTAASLYVCAGQRDRAIALLRDLQTRRASGDPIGDLAFATAHLALGQPAPALDALEAMYASGDAHLWTWLPHRLYGIEQLAKEPRFLALLGKLQLPAEALSWDPRA